MNSVIICSVLFLYCVVRHLFFFFCHRVRFTRLPVNSALLLRYPLFNKTTQNGVKNLLSDVIGKIFNVGLKVPHDALNTSHNLKLLRDALLFLQCNDLHLATESFLHVIIYERSDLGQFIYKKHRKNRYFDAK